MRGILPPDRIAIRQQYRLECDQNVGKDTACNNIGIKHHERQASIAFERMKPIECADLFPLVIGQPMIARHQRIVLVDLAEALLPIVKLAGADADPADKTCFRNLGLAIPEVDEINNGITGIVRNPAAFQVSPSSFFKRTCSSISSASTASLR